MRKTAEAMIETPSRQKAHATPVRKAGTPKKPASSHILSAPDGYRRISHEQIEAALEQVFRARQPAGE